MIFFKTIRRLLPGLLIVGLLVGFGCSSPSDSDDGGGGNGDDDPVTYELSVQANPSEAGSVDPESGTYEEGEEVEVTATAADGWEFTGWSGDMTSDDNPLTFTIDSDTELTAEFEKNAKAYSNQIKVSDGTNSESLTFGMHEDASAGFDSDLESEAPPAPPSGSYYAHLNIEGYNLYDDFRPIQDDQTIWEIEFSPSSSNTMTLTWDFSSSDYAGSLTVVDDPDNPSLEIDMEAETSYEVTDTSVNTLYIVQQ